jgi:hypothetical protein
MSDTGFIADTPEKVAMVRLLTIAHGLATEINTGMKMTRVSVLTVAQRDGLTVKRTKKGALRDVVKALKAARPDYVESGSIARALA